MIAIDTPSRCIGYDQAMKKILLLLCLTCLACTSIPVSTEAPDLTAIDDKWSIHVVTLDSDGNERVTRIWIALLDGDPVLRTGESRWWANLGRDPAIRIRLSGQDYAYRAKLVDDPQVRVRVDEIFLAKYGRWERMLFPQERGATHENYARLHRWSHGTQSHESPPGFPLPGP